MLSVSCLAGKWNSLSDRALGSQKSVFSLQQKSLHRSLLCHQRVSHSGLLCRRVASCCPHYISQL